LKSGSSRNGEVLEAQTPVQVEQGLSLSKNSIKGCAVGVDLDLSPEKDPPRSQSLGQPALAQNGGAPSAREAISEITRKAKDEHPDPARMNDDELARTLSGLAKELGLNPADYLGKPSQRVRAVMLPKVYDLLAKFARRRGPKPKNLESAITEIDAYQPPSEAESRLLIRSSVASMRAQIKAPRPMPAETAQDAPGASIRSGPVSGPADDADVSAQAVQELREAMAGDTSEPVDTSADVTPADEPAFQPEPPLPHQPAGELASPPIDLETILRRRKKLVH
jgi:hypothetical protein